MTSHHQSWHLSAWFVLWLRLARGLLAALLIVLAPAAALADPPSPTLLSLETFTNGVRVTWSLPAAEAFNIECWGIHRKTDGVMDKDYTLAPFRPSQYWQNGSLSIVFQWTDTNVVAGVEYTYSVLGYMLEGDVPETLPLTITSAAKPAAGLPVIAIPPRESRQEIQQILSPQNP